MLLVPVSRHLSSLSLLPSCRNREILELGLDNEDSEHENDEDTNQSKKEMQSMSSSYLVVLQNNLFFLI